jgi:hypothetical protein
LAHCGEDSAELSTASAIVNELLEIQPKLVPALVARARHSLRLGQPAAGEEQARRAVAIAPHNAEANSVLRLCLEAQGKQDESHQRQLANNESRQAELWRKLRDAPHDPAVCCEIGRWTAETGEEQESAGWFFLALCEDRHFVPAHAALAEYFKRAGQPRLAQAHRWRAGKFGEPAGNATGSAVKLTRSPVAPSDYTITLAPNLPEASSEQVHQFCGACHAYPPPDSMPKSVWRKEVKQGYDFFQDSKLSQNYPSLESVALYYENRAPDRLPLNIDGSASTHL